MRNPWPVLSLLLRMFLTMALIAAPFLTTPAQAQKTSKARPSKTVKGLGTLTFDQVAQLPHVERTLYVRMLRQATLEIDRYQRWPKYNFKSALNEPRPFDLFEDVVRGLLGDHADAQGKPNCRNICIYAGNESCYPNDLIREPFQCMEVTCNFRAKDASGRVQQSAIKGISCGFTYSGLANDPDIGGCLQISGAKKAYSSWACWQKREQLLGRKLVQDDGHGNITRVDVVTNSRVQKEKDEFVHAMLKDTDEFFGFNTGKFGNDLFQSPEAAGHLLNLFKMAYHDEAYAQLIKVAYFYKANNKPFPKELLAAAEEAGFDLDAIGSFHTIEKDFNNLNKAVEEIFFRLRYHCGFVPGPDGKYKVLDPQVVEDIRAGKYLNQQDPNTTAYKLEKERQQHLENLPAGEQPTHGNVLEKRECTLIDLRFQAIREEIAKIVTKFPDLGDIPVPQLPPPTPNAPDTKKTTIIPTGCTENVTQEESNLVLPAFRCAVCLIQSKEAQRALKKNPNDTMAGSYRPSSKYISLVSTMALACGDGYIENSTISPERLARRLAAAGHCSDKYDWSSDDDYRLAQQWNSQNDLLMRVSDGKASKRKLDPKKNPDHPDRGDRFQKIYGIKFEEAAKIFCDPARLMVSRSGDVLGIKTREELEEEKRKSRDGKTKDGYTICRENDEECVQKNLKIAFFQRKQKVPTKVRPSPGGSLWECMEEAEKVVRTDEQDSSLKFTVQPSYTSAQGIHRNGDNDCFLANPPVVFSGHNCYIPRQKEIYRAHKVITGTSDPCHDANNDNKDDATGKTCKERLCTGEECTNSYAYLWVPADMNWQDPTTDSSPIPPAYSVNEETGARNSPVRMYSHQPNSMFPGYKMIRTAQGCYDRPPISTPRTYEVPGSAGSSRATQ